MLQGHGQNAATHFLKTMAGIRHPPVRTKTNPYQTIVPNMTPPPATSSLRRKIILGYVAIGGLIMVLAMAALFELHQLESRVKTGSAITDFLNAVLEMRRYEKNFFLYNHAEDRNANRQWLAHARQIFLDHRVDLDSVLAHENNLEQNFQHYEEAMEGYFRSRELDAVLLMAHEEQVRQAGKSLASTAEEMAHTEKQKLFATLEKHRHILMASIVILALMVLVAGHILTRVVTSPLKQMEQTMRQVAEGHLGSIHIASRDQEIQSLTLAFNRMLMELRARQKHLVRSEKLASLGTMLSGVAHELNNPLSNIATSCQILLEESLAEPFHRELLEQIDSQTLRARDIVRSLLDFARDKPFRHQQTPLGPLLEETLRLLSAQISAEVTVVRQVADGVMVTADRQRLQQVLLNLIKNSVDALSGHGEILISGQRLDSLPDMESGLPNHLVAGNVPGCSMGPVVEISIQDNGMGIESSLLPRILDPFFTTKETGQGFGLGLFVAYEIIEEHGGCLVIDSQPGSGSTFRLYLPSQIPAHTEMPP